MKNNTVIVVQARMSSSRLYGKVMMQVLGESLLARMVERLRMIRHPATIVIATSTAPEDDIIELEAQKLRVSCYRGSLNNLVERHFEAAQLHQATTVLKIPSDCPLIDPGIADAVLACYFNNGPYDYVSNLHPASWPDGNDVEVMSMDCLVRVQQQASRPLELEHTTPYIWENPQDFKIGNVLWETNLDYSMSHRFTIDYREDYLFIKRVYEELYPKNDKFSCMDILQLLGQKPEIYQINALYAGVNWYRNHLQELKTVSAEQTRQSPELVTIAS